MVEKTNVVCETKEKIQWAADIVDSVTHSLRYASDELCGSFAEPGKSVVFAGAAALAKASELLDEALAEIGE